MHLTVQDLHGLGKDDLAGVESLPGRSEQAPFQRSASPE